MFLPIIYGFGFLGAIVNIVLVARSDASDWSSKNFKVSAIWGWSVAASLFFSFILVAIGSIVE